MNQVNEIAQALRLFHDDGERINLRVKFDDHTSNLFFTSIEECAERAALLDERLAPQATWTILNPIRPEALIPTRQGAKNGDISCFRWLPIDVDPVREVADGPATAEEAAYARRVADRVRAFIRRQRLGSRTIAGLVQPDPIVAFGGNSWHLLFPITPLPPDSTIVASILRGLDKHFSDGNAIVDLRNGNAARAWKLYGTWSRKGVESPGRPFRKAYIEDCGTPDRLLTLDELQHLMSALGEHEDAPRKTGTGIAVTAAALHAVIDMVELNLAAFANNIKFRGDWRAPDGTPALRYEFECPFFHDGHGAPGKRPAYCVIFRDGTYMAGCHGGRCAGRGWSDMTDRFLEGSHGDR